MIMTLKFNRFFSVTQNWALTAAHCFVAFPNAATTAIITGDHDLSTGSDTIWAAAYRIQRYIKHATFNPETNVNDIALARTVEYIKFKLVELEKYKKSD